MRRAFAITLVGLIVAVAGLRPAGATITADSGGVVKISRPASAADGRLRSNTQIRAWDELQDVWLRSPLSVNFKSPGTYDRQAELNPGTLSGMYVRSHFLHADRVSECTAAGFCYVTGSATFGHDVLGVMTQGTQLNGSDGRLGWASTTYATGLSHRGMEFRDFDPPNDEYVTLSSNRNTVTVRMAFANVMDEIRVVTAGINYAPVARNDTYNTMEDTRKTVPAAGVLANDTDANLGDVLTASVTDPPAGGLTFASNGAFTYTPPLNFVGTDTFEYRATDAGGLSAVASVTINVGSTCDVPVAVGDSIVVEEDASVTIDAPGVLGNDTDADAGDTLTAAVETPPAHGEVTLAEDGSLVYTPVHNWDQPDSFTYKAVDTCGGLASDPALVTIDVQPIPEKASMLADPAIARVDTTGDPTGLVTIFFPYLRATLTDEETGAGIPERSVTFWAGEQLLCTADTDGEGLAICDGALAEALAAEVGAIVNLGFDARFAGDVEYEETSDLGMLAEVVGTEV